MMDRVPQLSLVIRVYNEEQNLPLLFSRICDPLSTFDTTSKPA